MNMADGVQQRILSIIIPCYNEEENLKQGVLDEMYHYLIQQEYPWEVVIVNDGSSDKSQGLIESFINHNPNFFLFNITHRGKLGAIWAGIQHARGELILSTDMDQSTPISEVSKLMPWYEQGCDLIIGSRGATRHGYPVSRTVVSFIFGYVRRLLLLRKIHDTQCGFKLCRRQVALDMFPRLDVLKQVQRPPGWDVTVYDVELLYLTQKAGYHIKEVPIRWHHRDQSNTKDYGSGLTQCKKVIAVFQEIIQVKLNEMKGVYEET